MTHLSAHSLHGTLDHTSEVGQTSDKGKLADNVNTFAACFGFEDTETDKPVNLTPETQDKSPEKKAAEVMGYGLLPDHTTQRKTRQTEKKDILQGCKS